jgi:hypothetical protein
MTKTNKRRFKTQPDGRHSFAGAVEGSRLVEYLNGPRWNTVPIRGVLILFNEVTEAWKQSGAGDRLDAMTETKSIETNVKLLNILSHFKCVPYMVPGVGSTPPTVKWVPDDAADQDKLAKWERGWGPYTRYAAIRDVMTLAEKGLLARVKQCACGKWIYAKFPTVERHCSPACRLKAHRTPEWKEYRREWAEGNRVAKAAIEAGTRKHQVQPTKAARRKKR